jgi:hypothetical protein
MIVDRTLHQRQKPTAPSKVDVLDPFQSTKYSKTAKRVKKTNRGRMVLFILFVFSVIASLMLAFLRMNLPVDKKNTSSVLRRQTITLGDSQICIKILIDARIDRFSPHVIGVVTAVYFITGGLCYTGEVRAVANGGAVLEPHPNNTNPVENKAELEPQTSNTKANEGKAESEAHPSETMADTTHAFVALTPGWKVTVTGTNKIVLTERDPMDWIVAIEYLRLVKKDGRVVPMEVVARSPPVSVKDYETFQVVHIADRISAHEGPASSSTEENHDDDV